MFTVEEQWKLFERLCIQTPVSDLQRREMKRCFYAGVEALVRIQFKLADFTEEKGLETMLKISEELKDFGRKIKEGLA